MSVQYKKLWKKMIDSDVSSNEFRELTGIATSTLCKMKKNEYVSLDVLVRICNTFHCQLNEIVEVVFEE